MGAYHFSAKIHSRAKGASAVRAAAYRAAEKLRDDRLGKTEDYSRKADVIESAILAPAGAPGWCLDREALWNRVEAREKRRDAQVAQEFEINLPRELSDAENWRLITDFSREHLVAHGRICDINFHRSEAADGQAHLHAHVLMPLRVLENGEFGAKHRDVDWRTFFGRDVHLNELRAAWCEFSRKRAAELGIDLGADWDHRSYLDRGLDVEPQPKVGAAAHRRAEIDGTSERVEELLATQRRNGEKLLAEPGLALDALTRRQSTFTEYDLARWIHGHSADDQFQAIFEATKAEAVIVGKDERGRVRYSTREMIELESTMLATAAKLTGIRGHDVKISGDPFRRSRLSEEQKTAGAKLLSDGDLSCLVGYAGAGKSTMLNEVRAEFEKQGYTVRGAALSGIAAENLEQGSGIRARTLASWSYAWQDGRDALSRRDVFVIDEAGMIGSRQLAEVLQRAAQAGAKVVLVGDPEQLQAIEAGAAFRAIQERAGAAELTEIRRQKTDWQRVATRELATGKTSAALDRYAAAGAIEIARTDEEARSALVGHWHKAVKQSPEQSRIMLAHTRADTEALNKEARSILREGGNLGRETEFDTTRGKRQFGKGDRLIFLRNERNLAVKNGMLGTVERIQSDIIVVRTDDGRSVRIDTGIYSDFDHGYAVTVHKAQGVTVDRAFVLATSGFDRHLAYVALSRHRESLSVVYSAAQFKDAKELARVLGRERAKDVTTDYLDDIAEMRDLTREPAKKLTLQERLHRLDANITGRGRSGGVGRDGPSNGSPGRQR